jgi:hypothetical protein
VQSACAAGEPRATPLSRTALCASSPVKSLLLLPCQLLPAERAAAGTALRGPCRLRAAPRDGPNPSVDCCRSALPGWRASPTWDSPSRSRGHAAPRAPSRTPSPLGESAGVGRLDPANQQRSPMNGACKAACSIESCLVPRHAPNATLALLPPCVAAARRPEPRCKVRSSDAKAVVLTNPTGAAWQLRPIIQNDFWSGPEFLRVRVMWGR